MEFFIDEAPEADLQESHDHRIHAIAGACAGIMEHCGMFPIDTVKTHQQVLGTRSIATTLRNIMKEGGVLGLFRGFPLVACTAAPMHGFSFSVYEFCKQLTGANKEGHTFVASSISGVIATLAHDACSTPIDTIKQRLQLNSRPYKGVFDCVAQTVKKDGIGALYKGYTTAITMNLPYASIYYGSYESIKRLIKTIANREHKQNDPLSHMLAGAAGGCLAGALTNPLDVAKTRLQVGSDVGKNYTGMVNTLSTIWKEEGLAGYMKGIRPRMLFHSMSASISWTTYEYVKHVLEYYMNDKNNTNKNNKEN